MVAGNHARGQIIKDLIDICGHGARKVQFKTIPTIAESLRTNNGRHIGIRSIELADLAVL